ncbi:MAG TPA: GNAT family N-acetyltransferase, partial [Gammaproteobacteria bacterium]|nr:GNAT family N-acetyltransferase [Gammaproteobacteria bacterium]
SHIYHLFVSEHAHGKGVGRVLYNYIKTRTRQNHFTVNSSRHAIGFYQKLGFVATDAEQMKDGLFYLPMKVRL